MNEFLIVSGVAFWLMWLVIGALWLYDRLETEFFVWNQRRMWKKYYKKKFASK